jgi:CheY-like chemotaxis protein
MDGRVGFRSAAGVGSEFWVDFPAGVRRTETPVAPPRPNATSAGGLDGQRGRLVLYVEDNPANVAFMRDVLGDFEGIELACVPTAEMGIALARARHPDLVLMDINLPGMSGLEALGSLRRDPETSSIPVIALTAAASDRDKQRGQEAGFFRYLTKPVKVDELVEALETLLPR